MENIVTVATLILTLVSKLVEAVQNGQNTVDLSDIQAELSRITNQNAADDAAEWAVVHGKH